MEAPPADEEGDAINIINESDPITLDDIGQIPVELRFDLVINPGEVPDVYRYNAVALARHMLEQGEPMEPLARRILSSEEMVHLGSVVDPTGELPFSFADAFVPGTEANLIYTDHRRAQKRRDEDIPAIPDGVAHISQRRAIVDPDGLIPPHFTPVPLYHALESDRMLTPLFALWGFTRAVLDEIDRPGAPGVPMRVSSGDRDRPLMAVFPGPGGSRYEVTLNEGRARIVRREYSDDKPPDPEGEGEGST